MSRFDTLILVDSDTRRRATISHMLSSLDIHVEPFETTEELSGAWPRSGVILIHDEDGAVADLIVRMGHSREWFPIIAFGEITNPSRITQAILDGAIDYLVWPIDTRALPDTLERSHDRAMQMGSAKLREATARSRLECLTRREREVLDGVARGLSNRKIGEELEISPRTVEIHRANMLTKLGAGHTSDAIRIAIEAALVT